MNTLKAFAEANRVKLAKGADAVAVVPGKTGAIYEFTQRRLACHIEGRSVRACNVRVRNCEAAGMALIQSGDTEAVLTFDPTNSSQVSLAISVAGVKRRRIATAAQLVALAANRRSPKPTG